MADFSKAAYDLQTWEKSTIAGLRINDPSPLADQAYGELITEQKWAPVNLNPTLPSSERNYMEAASVAPMADAATLINRMDNGYYTNGNAAALVARSKDALVISFRGTNDNASQWTPTENQNDRTNDFHPDADQWGASKWNPYISAQNMIDHMNDKVSIS